MTNIFGIFKKYILTAVLALILVLQIINISSTKTVADTVDNSNESRMSGMWVTTTLNLDYPSKGTVNSAVLKSEADEIIENCYNMGITDIFFQVRSASDALYNSDIYPWSQWLTGSQGLAPDNNFDPLEYWIEESHSKGIKLHAWVNPYRVTNTVGLKTDELAVTNPARQHPDWVISYENKLYFDPALPEVQELVVSGVEEIVKNYDVDGIHLDDYFYPGADFNDAKTYAVYGNGMDKGDWRRENVNTLVSKLHNKIKEADSNVEFGISPVGVWANKENNPLGSDTYASESYYKNYADSRKWALEGLVDYIAPQIYWEIGHSKIDYATAVKWWADTLKDSDTKLYVGLADYKCDGVSASSAWYQGNAIKKQMELNKSIPKVGGEIHFRYKFVNNIDYLKNIVTNAKLIGEATTEVTTNSIVQPEPTTNFEVKPEITTESKIVNNTNDIMVVVNDKIVEFDQKPVIQNSRTLVPFRKIFEALGADVDWDNDTQQVRAKNENTEISFIIGEKVLLINQKDTIIMEVKPQIMNGRSMVPLRIVSETLGANVDWNDEERIITIETK